MNLDGIKKIFLKKDAVARSSNSAPLKGGRRSGESDNPYLSARRTWNDHEAESRANREMWRIFGICGLLVGLAGVGGATYIGSQSKFIPYVVEVDKLSEVRAAAPINPGMKVNQKYVRRAVQEFIESMRTVTPDVAIQRKMIFGAYAMLAANDPATAKANEWLNGNPDSNPFKRAERVMVEIKIETTIPQTAETWQVDWMETTRDRQGVRIGEPERYRAMVTTYTQETTPDTSGEQMDKNPFGIFVRDYSWSKQH